MGAEANLSRMRPGALLSRLYRKALLPAALAAFSAAGAAAQVQAPVRSPAAPVVVAPVAAPALPLASLSSLPSLSAFPLAAQARVPRVPSPIAAGRAVAAARGVAQALPARRALRLVITGPPGSGKGTYSKRISEDYGPVHISAGALLRAYAADRPELRAVMERGDLVPAELVVGLVRERLQAEDVRRSGFILDGFPRRVEEAKALAAMLAELGTPLDAVVFLDVPREELLRRILARGRSDDTEATFRERMRVYREETLPVLELLRGRGPFLAPSVASGDPETAYLEVRRSLELLPR